MSYNSNFFSELKNDTVSIYEIQKYDIKQKDSFDENALHYSVKRLFNTYNRKKLIEYLLQKGVNPNGKNYRGLTPFQIYINEIDGNTEIIDLFIKYGANLYFKDNDNNNVFHYSKPFNLVYIYTVYEKKIKEKIDKWNEKINNLEREIELNEKIKKYENKLKEKLEEEVKKDERKKQELEKKKDKIKKLEQEKEKLEKAKKEL
jgi:ankyrin repeat protein